MLAGQVRWVELAGLRIMYKQKNSYLIFLEGFCLCWGGDSVCCPHTVHGLSLLPRYTMSKSTAILFILLFAIFLKLEQPVSTLVYPALLYILVYLSISLHTFAYLSISLHILVYLCIPQYILAYPALLYILACCMKPYQIKGSECQYLISHISHIALPLSHILHCGYYTSLPAAADSSALAVIA